MFPDAGRRMNPPVEPRPASTLILVRDGDGDGDGDGAQDAGRLEVLLVQRNVLADFVGGAHVFPGGGVDVEDASEEARDLSAGRSDAEASALLGTPPGGIGYWVAALRECFEEAGILLAYRSAEPAGGPGRVRSLLSLDDPDDSGRFHRLRAHVNSGRRSFLDVCRSEGLTLACDLVHYFAHWVTPEMSPRRYDTRFFVAAAPTGQVPLRDEREIVGEIWISPGEALRRRREGEIDLVLPTVRCLQAMSRFPTAGALLAAVALAGAANGPTEPQDGPPGAPRMVREGQGLRIALPGDPGPLTAGSAQIIR